MTDQPQNLRERKKSALRSEMSQAALRLFVRRGFDAVTIDEIVEPLGVSTRTFFRYFPTKEDAVFAWYEELTDELVAALRARPASESPFDATAHALRGLVRHYDADPKWAVAMVGLSKQTPALRGKSHEKRLLWERALAEALVPRMAKSATRELRAQVVVGAAMSAFMAGVDAWANAKHHGDLRSYLDGAFAMAKEL